MSSIYPNISELLSPPGSPGSPLLSSTRVTEPTIIGQQVSHLERIRESFEDRVREDVIQRQREEAARGYAEARAYRVHEDFNPSRSTAREQNREEKAQELRGLIGTGQAVFNPTRAPFRAPHKQGSYHQYNYENPGSRIKMMPLAINLFGEQARGSQPRSELAQQEENKTRGEQQEKNWKKYLEVELEKCEIDVSFENIKEEVKRDLEKKCKGATIKRVSKSENKLKTKGGSRRFANKDIVPYLRLTRRLCRGFLIEDNDDEDEVFYTVMNMPLPEVLYFTKISHLLPSAIDPQISPATSFSNLLDIDKAKKSAQTWNPPLSGGPPNAPPLEWTHPPPYTDAMGRWTANSASSTGENWIERANPIEPYTCHHNNPEGSAGSTSATQAQMLQREKGTTPLIIFTPATSENSYEGEEEENIMGAETAWPHRSIFRRSIILQMGILYFILDNMRNFTRRLAPLEAFKKILEATTLEANRPYRAISNEETWAYLRSSSDEVIEEAMRRVGGQSAEIPTPEIKDGPQGPPLRRIHAGANEDNYMNITSDDNPPSSQQTGNPPPGAELKDQGPKKRRRTSEEGKQLTELESDFNRALVAVENVVKTSKIATELKKVTLDNLGKASQAFTDTLAKAYQNNGTPCNPQVQDLQKNLEATMETKFNNLKLQLVQEISIAMGKLPSRSEAEGIKAAVNEVKQLVETRKNGEPSDTVNGAPKITAPKLRGRQYSEVVAKITPAESRREKSVEKLKEDFVKVVNPRERGIQLKKLREGKECLVLVAENKEEYEKIKQIEDLETQGLKMTLTKTYKPEIVLRGVEEDLNKEGIQEAIYKQNPRVKAKHTVEQFKANFRPAKKFKPRKDRKEVNWIVECSPEVRNTVMTEGKLFVDTGVVYCTDRVAPTRCFKCHSFNHVAKFCREKEDICGFCAKSGHKMATCEAKTKAGATPRCAACIRSGEAKDDHDMKDPECPSYKRAREDKFRRTDYGL